MATIVAVCPYCRAGGVRAPVSAVGTSAVCPKCNSSFTVMPSDGVPGWATAPQTAAETKPTAALSDVTEPSPTLAPEPPAAKPVKARKKSDVPVAEVVAPPPSAAVPKAAEPVTPAPAPTAAFADPAEATDFGMVFGLGALTLFGVAVVATLFPFGRFVAAGLGVLGLLGGLAALAAEGKARLAGAGAVVAHSLLLLVVFLAPSLLSLEPWTAPPDDTPKGPQAVEHETGLPGPLPAGGDVDAERGSWQFHDVRVTVRSAGVGPVEVVGPKNVKRNTKEMYFSLVLRVSNAGAERDVLLTGWAAGNGTAGVEVTAGGQALKPAVFPGDWQPADRGRPAERVAPGGTSEVRLLFAAPPAKADSGRVQLSGAALGLE